MTVTASASQRHQSAARCSRRPAWWRRHRSWQLAPSLTSSRGAARRHHLTGWQLRQPSNRPDGGNASTGTAHLRQSAAGALPAADSAACTGRWHIHGRVALLQVPYVLLPSQPYVRSHRSCAGNHLQAANTGIKCFCFLGITSWCGRMDLASFRCPAAQSDGWRSGLCCAGNRSICRVRLFQELVQAEELAQKIETSQRQLRPRPSHQE